MSMTFAMKQLDDLERRLTEVKAMLTQTAEEKPQAGLHSKWDNHDSFSIPEYAEIMGIGVWTAYERVKAGEIEVIPGLGRRRRIGRGTVLRQLGHK